MSQAENGNLVSVEYTGRLLDGTVFDSNVGEDALQFTLGQGQVIAGFDNAVRGLQVGESVETTIEPENAYGQHQDELVLEFERNQFPADADPEIGLEVALSNGSQQFPATIVAVNEETVTLDANHRLAGETLVFTIKLLAIG
jgi:FKBP-type peptidyl-prolyl cis-trans isomerase 2